MHLEFGVFGSRSWWNHFAFFVDKCLGDEGSCCCVEKMGLSLIVRGVRCLTMFDLFIWHGTCIDTGMAARG